MNQNALPPAKFFDPTRFFASIYKSYALSSVIPDRTTTVGIAICLFSEDTLFPPRPKGLLAQIDLIKFSRLGVKSGKYHDVPNSVANVSIRTLGGYG